MADPEDAAPLLPRLPADVLRSVWECLYEQYNRHDEEGNRHQHALRRSCKALAASTAPFISSSCVHLESWGEGEGWELLLHRTLTSLQAFPKSCQLSSLTLSFRIMPGEERAFAPLLPNLMMQPSLRLSGLVRLTIEGYSSNGAARIRRSGLCLTYGDLASISLACPQLQQLTLDACLCSGPLFAALRGLPGLRDLRALNLDIPPEERAQGQTPDALRSLSTLTQLSSLSLSSAWSSPEGGLCLEDALPPLRHLHSLTSLSMLFSIDQPEDTAAIPACLSRLSRLEQLTFGPRGAPRPALSADHLAFLPATSRLTSLNLRQAILDDSVLHLLARVPSLTRLSADCLRLKADCSGLPCSLDTLQLRGCPSPEDLAKLPPGAIRALRFDFWNMRVSGGAAAAGAVRSAAQLLALHWDASRGAAAASVGVRRRGLAAPHCDAVLAALAPLAAKRLLTLTLDGWAVGPDTILHLAAAFPQLRSLALVRCAVGAGALGAAARLPALTQLRLLSEVSVADVLTTLVLERWRVRGPELDVELGGCVGLSQAQLDELNAGVAAARDLDGGAGKASVQLCRWLPVGGWAGVEEVEAEVDADAGGADEDEG